MSSISTATSSSKGRTGYERGSCYWRSREEEVMPQLTKTGEAIRLFSTNPTMRYTPTAVAQALALPTKKAQAIIDELESEGKIEALEDGKHALQRARYRWVSD
jgi:hypothetical protein